MDSAPLGNTPEGSACGSPQIWSATGRGRGDAFVRWREVVCQAFTRLSPERVDDGPFAGEIRMQPFAHGGSISRITATGQTVRRRREDVAGAPCDAVFLNIQVGGRSVVRQREVETRLTPGSFTLLDARRPFAMRFDGAFQQVCLHLPFAWFDDQGFDPTAAVARRLDRGSAFGAALLDYVGAVMDGTADEAADAGGTDPAGGDHVAHLVRLACQDGVPAGLADQHLALVRRFVAAHCAEPGLSPGAVAGHFRMSVRYLHKLFARSGESFGQFLLRTRLERSLDAILRRPDRSITEIALDAGFNDASHFARSFRRRYGRTPSTARPEAGRG